MKEPKIRKMNWLVRLITLNTACSITIAPFGIFLDEECVNDQIIINHEKIHWIQQNEISLIPIFVWYFIEWLCRLSTGKIDAFISISFEREAFENENNPDYLKTRKPYAWLKYLRK